MAYQLACPTVHVTKDTPAAPITNSTMKVRMLSPIVLKRFFLIHASGPTASSGGWLGEVSAPLTMVVPKEGGLCWLRVVIGGYLVTSWKRRFARLVKKAITRLMVR